MKTFRIILVASIVSIFIFLGVIIRNNIFHELNYSKKFVFVIPSYNNKDWYLYNLNSVFSQTYKNFRVIYVDDCSSDGTYELVKNYLAERSLQDKVTLIGNAKRKGALANHYTAISMCHDDEIIVCLDGDDWLADDDVLAYLAGVYADESVWLTYGQFCNWPTGELGWCEEIPKELISKNEIRKFGFVSPQLRTYYAWLAKLVKKEDLIWEKTNDFFPISGDVALMFPMLEMCGSHFKFIEKILCQRNVATPLNDFKINPDLQITVLDLITSKQPYLPLNGHT